MRILSKIKRVYREGGVYCLFLTGLERIGLLKKIRLFQNNLHNFYWLSYSRLLNKPLIYVIGDSHAKVFEKQKMFIVYHLGAATAYKLKDKVSTTNSNQKLFSVIKRIKKRDIVMLVFGEIDCRIHIYNEHKKSGISIRGLIGQTISRYGDVLRQLDARGVNFFVLGVPPASRRKSILPTSVFYGLQFYASSDIRSKINREFNQRMKDFCQENYYKYIDVYSKTSDKNGFMMEEYAKDDIHLNNKAVRLIREFLKI